MIELFYTLKEDKAPRKWIDPMVSFRNGAMLFMQFMFWIEKKYLPSCKREYIIQDTDEYHSRWSQMVLWSGSDGDCPMQKVWDLQISPEVTHSERLVMESMMDRAYFLVSDFDKVSAAWIEVAESMSSEKDNDEVKEDFEYLISRCKKLIYDIPGIYSIAVHWSSVCNFFDSFGKTDENCYDFVADNVDVESNFDKK